MKKTFYAVGALWVLGAVACGGIKEQDIGDSVGGLGASAGSASALAGSRARGGANGDDDGSTPLAGSATTHGGSTSVGGAPSAGDCENGCAPGFGCYQSRFGERTVCAPICEDQVQRQHADDSVACGSSVRGGPGTCVSAETYAPVPAAPSGAPVGSANQSQGLCSNLCDPLLQDCPSGFSCDFTGTYSAVAEQAVYACMPVLKEGQAGDDCDGTENGNCAAGFTCNPFPNLVYKCVAFCDLQATNPCPGTQTCTASEITTIVGNPNVGICGD
jgi:hypothetical protein